MGYEDTDAYKAARAEYVAATAVAERTNDEVGKLKAELKWLKDEQQFKDEYTANETKANRLKEVQAQIEKDYPNVPKSLIQHITDPEALLQVAKDMSASMGGDWGAPAGASGGAPTTNKKKERDALIDRVNTGDPQANREFRRAVIDEKVIPFMQRQMNVSGS